MTARHASVPFAAPRAYFGAVWDRNPPLAALVVAMVTCLVVSLLGLAADPRLITGVSAWMKPLKFAVSIAVYGATLLWMLTFIRDRPRLVAAVSWGLFIGLTLEMVLIVAQVTRGTTSHFNVATPFDAAVWGAMGATITVVWLLNVAVAILLLRRRFAPSPVLWGVRLGLVAALLGMAVAFLMTRPTPDQLAFMQGGGASPIVGAHAVGVADGGPGLPIVGWSTTGGDLRVAHFIGLHALQVVPLVGLALERVALGWLSMRDRARLVGVVAAAWIGLTLLLTWQALRGQPVFSPDAVTLAALGGSLALVAVAAGAIVGRAWRNRRGQERSDHGRSRAAT